MLSLALGSAPKWMRRLFGLVRILSVVLFLTVGCGASGEGRPSTSGEQSKEPEACPGNQQANASQTLKTEQASTGDCVAQNRQQGPEPATAMRTTPSPKGNGPKSIPGMNADATLISLQKPGLECWEPADREVLYACSGDENPNLLHEARIRGTSVDAISGVEARVFWQGTGHFEQSSRSFFGYLSTQLRYRGADSARAFEFVNRNLSSTATTTIGAARWTMTSSENSKELTLTPVS